MTVRTSLDSRWRSERPTRRPGQNSPARTHAVHRGGAGEIVAWQGVRPNLRIVRAVLAALADPQGVSAHRRGALERARLVLDDWQHTTRRLTDTETRMVAVLDELELTGLVTSIAGLTAVGAATILAETGDLTRFRNPRAVVKHAGLCPRDNASGQHAGKTTISGRGRPALRLATWRAVSAALPNNPVLAARFTHLATREQKTHRGRRRLSLDEATVDMLQKLRERQQEQA